MMVISYYLHYTVYMTIIIIILRAK